MEIIVNTNGQVILQKNSSARILMLGWKSRNKIHYICIYICVCVCVTMTKIIELVSWKQHKKNMNALKNQIWLFTKVVPHIKKSNTILGSTELSLSAVIQGLLSSPGNKSSWQSFLFCPCSIKVDLKWGFFFPSLLLWLNEWNGLSPQGPSQLNSQLLTLWGKRIVWGFWC